MEFHTIELEHWERKQHFEHYVNNVPCGFSITANIDITAVLTSVKAKSLKFYPAFLHMVSAVVNAHREFRTCYNEDKELGYWVSMNPSYTIFHQDTETFSNIWTQYSDDFGVFYRNVQADMELYADNKDFQPKPDCPPNSFPVSSIPWSSFTGFNLNIYNNNDFFLPIVTGGKYFEQNNTVQLPVSLQVHHAVVDGYHASRFMNELQQLAAAPETWINI